MKRRLTTVLLALAGLLGATSRGAAAAAVAGAMKLQASSVIFYSDHALVVGDGNVVVRRADGAVLRGDYFAMDLRLNRYVVAGNVTLQTATQTLHGAAFSEYIDFARSYFLPVAGEPDRWTYLDDDFSQPLRGREMPGDAFALPPIDLGDAYIRSTSAVIVPKTSIRFVPATLDVQHAGVPLPSYFYVFAENSNFAQNSLAGAELDAPVPFAGGDHALATAHLRYDATNKVYAAYEQHLVSDRSYLVWSINPLTRPQKQYNLVGFDRLSPNVQVHGFFQESAFQHGFSQPLSAGGLASFQMTAGLRHSFLQLSLDQFYQSFLANPAPLNYYGDPSHVWVPDHASDGTLSWTGVDTYVHDVPVKFRLRSGVGFAHNGITPLFTLEGTPQPTVTLHFVGLTLFAPQFELNTDRHGRETFLNLSADKQRTWYNLPHYTDASTYSASVSKSYSKKFSAFLEYALTQTSDVWGGRQLQAYPVLTTPPTSLLTGEAFPGYLAFHGLATSRSYVAGISFAPSANVVGSFLVRHNRDFPEPIPEPTNLPQIGVAPNQATLDVRILMKDGVSLDLSRSYFFHFGNQNFNPQFTFLISR